MRSSARNGARSCRVTTTEASAPSGPLVGVALMSVVTLRPSGTESSISSARTVSALSSACASRSRSSAISRPSARRQVMTPSNCSADWPGPHRLVTMRVASRLSETTSPVPTSNTTTPTGVVSIRASRRARALCSARWVRALAIAVAACAANSARIRSSASVNASPPSFSTR